MDTCVQVRYMQAGHVILEGSMKDAFIAPPRSQALWPSSCERTGHQLSPPPILSETFVGPAFPRLQPLIHGLLKNQVT